MSTEGIGVFDAALVNGQKQCQNGFRDSNNNRIACTTSAAWDLANAASGRETQTDSFDPQGKLLGRSVTVYQATCPPSGISASPAFSWYGNWDGHLVAELDPSNPATVCDVQEQRTTSYSVDGVTTAPTSSNVPTTITTYSYDSYGRVTQSETTGNSGTATDVITQTQYIWNDAVSTAGAVPTGTYLIDTVASQVMQDPQNNPVQCTYHDYDGQSFATGQQSGMTRGLETGTERYTLCAPLQASNWVPQVMSYNANGDLLTTTDADGRTGVAGHVATTGSCTGFTACRSYDSNYGVVPVSSTNVLNQTTSTAYPTTAATGFGLWPASTTNANGQTSSRTYDALGRVTTTTAPGEGAGLSTGTLSYPLPWCPTTGAALACAEVDATQRVDATTTVTSRHFYDGLGRPVESRKPGPSGQDVIQYALYNDLGLLVFVSQGYFVPAYTGVAGASAFSTPDGAQHGVATIYDSMGRVTSTTDLAGKTTTTSYTTVCAPAGTNDTGCYSATTVTDANGHQSASYSDALGRLVYTQQWTGRVADGNLTLYRTIQQKYDVAGNVVETDYSDGSHKATASYDAIGRKTSFTDPDLGTYQLTYDPNSNLLSSNDPRGASGSLYQGYDGLNRLKGKSTHSDGSSALATYSYDSTASGNQGVGHLTGETFASGPNQSTTGNYVYAYDARGRQTGWTMALGSQSYTFSTGYNDADQPLTLTYPDGDVVTTSYSAQDWLAGVTEAQSGTTTTLLNSLVYSGAPGATMKPSQAVIGNNTYKWTLGYDSAVRLTHTTVAQVSNNATLFDQSRTFDNVGNVITTNTTLSQGTDNQAFCYDALNRLTWAGSTGTAPTGCTSPTTGTLSSQGAQYTQPYSYDVLNRFNQGPLGAGYVYGDATHLDAVTSTPSYSASYDAAGSMITRNGQQLGYDALRRLITWQNTVNNPTQTASYAYNGEGERVQQSVTNTGTLTTTSYIGAEEEISVTGGTTTTLKYYNAGPVTAIRVNGTLSYEVNDNLGSVSQVLSASGGVTATQLYSPYGTVRFTQGTMPSSHGFTDQRQDASGLNYDHARYYDPGLGQFITADNAMGDNRYGYVLGNPETVTDPSGNCPWCIGALIGAVVGAAVSYGSQVVANVQAHGLSSSAFTQVDAGAIAKAALAGAIIGAGGALLEGMLGVGLGAKLVVGAVTGAAGQMLDNAMNNRPLFDDVAKAAAIGTVTAGLTHYGGKFLKNKFGGKAPDVACNSFQGDTPVATPTGSQAINTLKVGDQVTAYDSKTGKAQPETVQHVFINHDDNLLDVTIADAKPVAATDPKNKQQAVATAAHGSQAPPSSETIHTTTEHPFLTNDRGFVDAVKLVAGEHVTKLDGSLGVVIGVTIVPGQAVRYNLTVQDEHTFAIGQGQWVVHNCPAGGGDDTSIAPSRTQAIKTARANAGVGRASRGDINNSYESDLNPGSKTPNPTYDPTKRFVGQQNLDTGAYWREDLAGHNDFNSYDDPTTRPWHHDYAHVHWGDGAGNHGIIVYGRQLNVAHNS